MVCARRAACRIHPNARRGGSIAAIPGGAELLSKTVCPILTEDAFILDVTLTCVEDIALSVPIRVDG